MNHPTEQAMDSFDYCIEFWQDAIDAKDEIDHFLRETSPHHLPQFHDGNDAA